MEALCRHELPPDQCDFCKPKPPMPRSQTQWKNSKAFPARFTSRCRDCQDAIHEGDMIRYNADDEIVHEDCDS